MLLALAATSFQRAIRVLGGKRWQALHRSVYAAALLAVLHFFWMRAGKNNFAEVAVYAAILGALLGWRVWRWQRRVRMAIDLVGTGMQEGVVQTGFGIGTNLSNDTGLQPLNIVMKLVNCNGQPTAKLSDSPGKTLCDDQTFLAYLRQVFHMNGQA